jgi:hypothetical protein
MNRPIFDNNYVAAKKTGVMNTVVNAFRTKKAIAQDSADPNVATEDMPADTPAIIRGKKLPAKVYKARQKRLKQQRHSRKINRRK